MTRNRAERRHPMMRLKKLIVALMIDVNAIGRYRGVPEGIPCFPNCYQQNYNDEQVKTGWWQY